METLPLELHYHIVHLIHESKVSSTANLNNSKPLLDDTPHLGVLTQVSRYWRSLLFPLLLQIVVIDGASNSDLQYFITTYPVSDTARAWK